MEKVSFFFGRHGECALRKQTGFTLIELMVTLSVLAILLAIAVPNYITFIQNARLTGQANDLVTALNYARSEAIKRGVRTTVCSLGATNSSCAGSNTWDTGWLVFVDCTNVGVRDTGNCPDWDANGAPDDEPVLVVRPPLENGNTLRTVNLPDVTYQNSGFSGNMGTFRLCDIRGVASGRAIVVNPQGRVRTGALINEVPALTCP